MHVSVVVCVVLHFTEKLAGALRAHVLVHGARVRCHVFNVASVAHVAMCRVNIRRHWL